MLSLLNEIWQTARRNRLRTALTGFSVAWGIFMLIVLLGAGNGLINAQMANVEQWVDNSMTVWGGTTRVPYDGLKEGRSIDLTVRDIHVTETHFPDHVLKVGAVISSSSGELTYGDRYVSCALRGVYPVLADINKVKLIAGRFINETDLRYRRKVCVLAGRQARELLPSAPERMVGEVVCTGSLAFTVVGVTKEDPSDMNTSLEVPFTTLQTIYNKGAYIGNISFSFHGLPTEEANETFETAYRAVLNKQHRAAPDDRGALYIWNRFTDGLQMAKGVSIVRTALWVIGLFTLLGGIVGVGNIMLITVRERTHEFGIRKAIGATPAALLRVVIAESIIITAFFGYIGMLLGILANLYMDHTLGSRVIGNGIFSTTIFVNPTVDLATCLEVMAVLIVAGTMAGLMPALKAARTRPIEALRAD